MLEEFNMPSKQEVQAALLIALFNNNGTIKEFGEGEEIVNDIATKFQLNEKQISAKLETIYKRENRIKKVSLWHRLLFRAADNLSKNHLILRPFETFSLFNKKEWMLTEKGYDRALFLLNIPLNEKADLSVKSFEVQTIINQLNHSLRPQNYTPFSDDHIIKTTRDLSIRSRAFRQVVIEAYKYTCAICGLKICSPNAKTWEVQAAHIVPYSAKGKDDILNGISLCHLHHWAFDVGWLSFQNDYSIIVSDMWKNLPMEYGRMENYSLLSNSPDITRKIRLPDDPAVYPHRSAIEWHRNNIFNQQKYI